MRPATAGGAVALGLILLGCATVPYTGRHHLILISGKEETQMGLEAYQKTLKESSLSSAPVQTAMVRRIGERLARVADQPDFKWEFNLIEDDKTVNAFCLPGGKVAVYTGILPVTKNETGMAVVMGHEIGHAIAHHGAERMSQQLLVNLGGTALSAALSSKAPETRQVFGEAYGLGTGLGVILPFSRSHESEADHIGLILMAQAGYDPREAVEFWKRMEEASKSPESPMAKYFSTHPGHGQRIRQIQEWMPEALDYYRKAVPAK